MDHPQVKIDSKHIETVKDLYSPADHPIFELVPPSFHVLATTFYEEDGSPVVTRTTCWDVYRNIQRKFFAMDPVVSTRHLDEWNKSHTTARDPEWGANEIQMLHGEPLANPAGPLAQIPGGYQYDGGVNGGRGLGM